MNEIPQGKKQFPKRISRDVSSIKGLPKKPKEITIENSPVYETISNEAYFEKMLEICESIVNLLDALPNDKKEIMSVARAVNQLIDSYRNVRYRYSYSSRLPTKLEYSLRQLVRWGYELPQLELVELREHVKNLKTFFDEQISPFRYNLEREKKRSK